ncbi:MAG: oligosaccharide flippase family protein [Actinomycetota bacterium]|nr:oligosaccharide flippase family protein [Actinomycetota bacterium]
MLTHALGIATYGVWAVLISILSLTSVLQMGLAPAVTFHVAQAGGDPDVTRTILATSFVLFATLGALAGLILSIGAHPIASVSFRSPERVHEAASVLPLLGFAACCQFLRQWVMAAEAGLQRYDLQAWADGLGTIALYGGLIVLAVLDAGIGPLAAWWGIASLGTVVGHGYLWRARTSVSVTLRDGWDSRQARVLFSFGVRQWASQLGGSFFGQVDRVIVNLILGPAAAGIYAAGTSVAVRINELSAAPVQVVGPAIAAAPSLARKVLLYRRAQALNAALAYGLAAVVMLGSEPLARVLVPTQPDTMASVLRILGFCYGVYSVNAVAFFAAQGVGRPSINSRWVMAAGCAFVLAIVPLSRLFGSRGAAWANLAYAVTLGINLEVLGSLALRKTPSLLTGTKLLISLAACFVVSATAVSAIDNALAQLLVGVCTLVVTGGWIVRRLLTAAADSLPRAGVLV